MSNITNAHWSRRAVLAGGLLAAAGTLVPHQVSAGDAGAVETALSKLPLITKRIPSTRERLPAIGIGTNAWRAENYDELRAVLKRMQELGGAVVDSSNSYFDSEEVIGRALTELGIRDKMFVTTKFNADKNHRSYVEREDLFGQPSFDRSLQRLQTKKIDLMFVHHLPSVDPLMPLLQELKKTGKVRYSGMSVLLPEEHAELMDKMRKYPVDFVEVDYSIENRDAASTVLPLALERKIAVIVDTPFGGSRRPLLPQVANRELPPWAADIDVTSWAQFFLKYVISHPAVTCAIPGSTKVKHLVDNQLAGHGRLPDAAMRKKMEDYWDAMV
jgi:aryl-alcohol dehydrogenase-like predicted oxidoreductase